MPSLEDIHIKNGKKYLKIKLSRRELMEIGNDIPYIIGRYLDTFQHDLIGFLKDEISGSIKQDRSDFEDTCCVYAEVIPTWEDSEDLPETDETIDYMKDTQPAEQPEAPVSNVLPGWFPEPAGSPQQAEPLVEAPQGWTREYTGYYDGKSRIGFPSFITNLSTD